MHSLARLVVWGLLTVGLAALLLVPVVLFLLGYRASP